jgi:signal transduction histidine kinase
MLLPQFVLLITFYLSSINTTFAHPNPTLNNKTAVLAKQANELLKKGDFEQSLVQSRLALSQAIALKNDNLIASCYNTIAANFDQLSEFDKAFYYYNQGLTYANKTNNDVLKNWIHNNLANIYCFDKKEYKKGIYHYKKSLSYSQKLKDSAQIVFTKLNITWAYFDVGNFNQGAPHLDYINKHHPKHGDKSTMVALNMLNGMYQASLKNNKKADQFFQKAINEGIAGNEKSDLSYSHNEYAKFLLSVGDYKNAYLNLARYNQITEELNNEEKLNKANVAGINLQIDEYKREIDKIENQFEDQKNKLLKEQDRNKKIVIVVVIIVLLLSLLFYIWAQNSQLKHKNKLKDLKSKVQENIINASINGQELERKKIASFLHDNISALLSSAGMQLQAFLIQNPIASPEIKKTKAILDNAHDQVRDLSHELMPSLLARFGLFDALEDLCEKNSSRILEFKFNSATTHDRRYHEEFEIKIYYIVMELTNNIIKHSEANQALLEIEEINQALHINLKDNGKGFDSKNFQVLEGFGINQIKARINNLKGSIIINSKLNYGSSIQLQIPIAYQKKKTNPVYPTQ